MNEIWKDIKGYEGSYQVSSLGNVKSLDRVVIKCNGVKQFVPTVILKKIKGNCNYHQVTLPLIGVIKNFRVHRLVMTAFHGHSHLPINHIDGNKLNNNLNNLEYVTSRENANHWVKVLVGKKKYGAYFDKCKNKWKSIIQINNKRFYLGSFSNEEEAHQAFYEAYTFNHGVSPW